jgi:hypothetical protein
MKKPLPAAKAPPNSTVSQAQTIRIVYITNQGNINPFKFMKKTLQTLLMIGKYYLYGFCIQIFL